MATTLIQTTTSNDFGVTFNTTPITISSEIGSLPQIVTDYSGKYVYISYQFDPGANQDRVLFSRSIDFGQTYTLGGSQKTLSSLVTNSPEITTNANGQYVYVNWVTAAPNTVEFVRSSDFGENWPAPASAITLSDTTAIKASKIATSDSGQYINVLWAGFKSPATIHQIQISRSQDFGQTWTAFVDIPILSKDDLSVSTNTDLTMSGSGQYVYAAWRKDIGGSTIAVQFSRSEDFGATWTSGINLSTTVAAVVTVQTQITTDKTGKYVYIIWGQSGALGKSIQIRRSTDFGRTFDNPVIISRSNTPGGPCIITDAIGRYVYAVWGESSTEQYSILSFDFGINFTPPLKISSPTLSSSSNPVLTMASSGIYAYVGFDRILPPDFFIIAQAVRGVDIPRTVKRFKFTKP